MVNRRKHRYSFLYKYSKISLLGSSRRPMVTFVKESYDRVVSYFGSHYAPGHVDIVLLASRRDMDRTLNHPSPKWFTAYTWKSTIYILRPESLEAESSHAIGDYAKLLVHELTHVFVEQINPHPLLCLDEGLALNLAGQVKRKVVKHDTWVRFAAAHLTRNGPYGDFVECQGYTISYWITRYCLVKYGGAAVLQLIRLGITPLTQASLRQSLAEARLWLRQTNLGRSQSQSQSQSQQSLSANAGTSKKLVTIRAASRLPLRR